ncbi:hypothetical protein AB0M46_23350 [Dactylosporangium sp. NPDC051485]|uniref:hypothetical protein n=1 Tax=Dactylosporangium sp. NPDC051485 TaxID=3154846 RepID=UPI00344258FF
MLVKPISAPPVQDSAARVVVVPFGPFSAAQAAQKPMRLNNASVCIYCMTRWCTSERCVAMHAASLWIVCETCDGFDVGCDCMGGVVETSRDGCDEQAFRSLPMTAPVNDDGEFAVYVVAETPRPVVGPWGVER